MKSAKPVAVTDPYTGRTPQGVRGLKFKDGTNYVKVRESHPARGAWIEIFSSSANLPSVSVAPRKGCVD